MRNSRVEVASGCDMVRARREEPRPGIFAERRIEEDHVELAAFVCDERSCIADARLDRRSAEITACRLQCVDEGAVPIDGNRKESAAGGCLQRQRAGPRVEIETRSEEHTSELQSHR